MTDFGVPTTEPAYPSVDDVPSLSGGVAVRVGRPTFGEEVSWDSWG